MKNTNTAIANNNELFSSTMKQWNCSYLEAYFSAEFGYETIGNTRRAIAQAVTYNRFLVSLLPGVLQSLRTEYCKSNISSYDEEALQKHAKEIVADQAYQFAYEWNQIDDYFEMTEAEKEAVIYGKSDNTEN